MAQCVTKLSSMSACLVFLAGGLYAFQSIQTISNTRHTENLGQPSLNHNIKKKKSNKHCSQGNKPRWDDSLGQTDSALKDCFSDFFFITFFFPSCFDQKGELHWVSPWHTHSHDMWLWQEYLAKSLQCTWILPEHLFYADFSGDENSFREFIWLSILILIKHVG